MLWLKKCGLLRKAEQAKETLNPKVPSVMHITVCLCALNFQDVLFFFLSKTHKRFVLVLLQVLLWKTVYYCCWICWRITHQIRCSSKKAVSSSVSRHTLNSSPKIRALKEGGQLRKLPTFTLCCKWVRVYTFRVTPGWVPCLTYLGWASGSHWLWLAQLSFLICLVMACIIVQPFSFLFFSSIVRTVNSPVREPPAFSHGTSWVPECFGRISQTQPKVVRFSFSKKARKDENAPLMSFLCVRCPNWRI